MADFSATPRSGNSPLSVQFTDLSGGMGGYAAAQGSQKLVVAPPWSWDFENDGIIDSSEQNPVHTYSSPGTYTVSLTVTNDGGSDTETKTGYVVVTASLPMALNVLDGTTGWVISSSQYQTQMGYSPVNVIGDIESNPREMIRQNLSSAQIFQSEGHGSEGMIEVKYPNIAYYAGNVLDYQFDELPSYTNMDLAMFVGCNTGGTSSLFGNLVDVIADKGGKCVMGWTRSLSVMANDAYIHQFWDQISQGFTVEESYQNAVTIMGNDYICISNHAQDPDTWTAFCNLDMLYMRENDGGCHVRLAGADINQFIQDTHELKNGKIQRHVDTFDVPESVKQFVSSSEHESEKITFQRSVSGLEQYNTDNASFWVDSNNGRVQSAVIHEGKTKTRRQIINLEQGSAIAESFAREKYPELWNTTRIRGTKLVTQNVLDRGIDQQFQYEWRDVYYLSDRTIFPQHEIPGPDSVFVAVSPYTGKVVQYSEQYSQSVVNGFDTLWLAPIFTEEQARKTAEKEFSTVHNQNMGETKPESLGLTIIMDENKVPHLTWNFKFSKTQTMGTDEQQGEYAVYAYLSIDAHDGSIVRKSFFE